MSNYVYSNDLSAREGIVYAYYATSEDLEGLDTYEEYLTGETQTQTFDAIREISITDAETGEKVTTAVTSADDVYDAFDKVGAGDKMEIIVEAVGSRRVEIGQNWFGQPMYTNVLALSGTEETITVDSLSQYRYAPPAAPSIG